jgi:peptide/nickel transport system permease protein
MALLDTSPSPASATPKRRWRPKASYVIVAVLVAYAVIMPLVAPDNAITVNPARRFQPPFGATWFGTDNLGRDLGTLGAIGLRTSLLISALVVALAGIIGWTVGAISAYAGGWIDDVLGRVMDAFNTFPGIILAISLTAALGPSFWTLIWVLVMVTWVNYGRVVRARVLAMKNEEYIVAARSYGASPVFVLVRHVWPNTIDLVLSVAMGQIANVMLAESSITFLGFGLQPPDVSLGSIIYQYQAAFDTRPWLFFWPAFFIIAIALTINFIGDGLRDALDPYLQNR